MSTVQRHWTVADRDALPDDGNRYEVIDGELFVTPAPAFRHQEAIAELYVLLLVDGQRPSRFEDVGRLLLAVEVLSPSTARVDRVTKRTLYREEGVAEYWVIDLDSRAIERSIPGDARIEVLDQTLSWRPAGAASDFEMDVRGYFARVLDG